MLRQIINSWSFDYRISITSQMVQGVIVRHQYKDVGSDQLLICLIAASPGQERTKYDGEGGDFMDIHVHFHHPGSNLNLSYFRR